MEISRTFVKIIEGFAQIPVRYIFDRSKILHHLMEFYGINKIYKLT